MWRNEDWSSDAVAAACPSASDTRDPQLWQNRASSATGELQCAQIIPIPTL